MQYRNLGRTGVKVSPLCLGCMMFGRKTSAEDSYAVIDRAIDAGIEAARIGLAAERSASENRRLELVELHGR